jgi:hypothetical protein
MRKREFAKEGKEDQADAPLDPDQYKDFSWNYPGAIEWERAHPDWVGAY